MPNHCQNTLTVTCFHDTPGSEITRFAKHVGPLLDFNTAIPYPQVFLDIDSVALRCAQEGKPLPRDGFNSGGYEWRVENWGTKWPSYSVRTFTDEGIFIARFETAWEPPVPVIKAWSEQFHGLEFNLTALECGMEYGKIISFVNGEPVSNISGHYTGRQGG